MGRSSSMDGSRTNYRPVGDPDLWQRIAAFALDAEGDPFPFSARLARENGWSSERARGAIDEYKKFMYLICVANSPLTPSEAVDQVWHLHLVYTRSYWKSFCEGVLGRVIHHDPTKGGEEQVRRFAGQYAETCALYEREFGSPPPVEFWPPVSERFASAPRQQWIDLRRHWVLRKPSGLGGMLRGMAAVPLLLLASAANLQAETEAHASGLAPASGGAIGALAFFCIFFVVILLIALSSPRNKNDKDDGNWTISGGCGGCGGCGG